MPLDAREITQKCRELQNRYRGAEARWQDVRACRQGDLDQVFPDLANDDWPKPIIANFVDTVARDLAEMVAPLPAFNCSSATMASDVARKFADKRSKIAQWYLANSRLDVQMLSGADHYFTYGVAVFYVEPDFDDKIPRITVEEPIGGYPEYDRWGRITSYTKRWYGNVDVMANRFPEFAGEIRQASKDTGLGTGDVELIRYCDKEQITLVLNGKSPAVLASAPNRLGETPIAIAHRAWLSKDEPKGQFDDVIWVQIARDVLAKLQLEATEKVVQAPIAYPNDVQEITYGPDAIIRTGMPEKVRRVPLEVPPAAFTESQLLLEEMRQGTRYPGARTGSAEGSIITGKGVQALMGGFDTQIKSAQMAFRSAFVDVMRLCFKMDETFWPNVSKDVRGNANGTPFAFTYKPAKDINGDHSIDVTYGFAAGLDPNRAVVMMLQLRAEKLFSRDFMARQLPFDLNVREEQTKVDVEETREAIKQAVFAYVQSIPAMAQMGQDPSQAVVKITQIVAGLQKGRQIEDVVSEAFAPQPPQEPETGPGEPEPGGEASEAGGAGGMGGPNGGLMESGLMRGVAPGQAGQAPGSRPDLNVMLAGITGSGNPQMGSFVMRRRRV